ncbi:beta-lactamase-like protein [alpha proteobacterium BAL199]|jgi:glyoxylase-like metal-dependent hydrolase (beta-lactamase superfamily II)|nr:beta-lactamase-like protein [alpha proteobacterium BAL199]
MTDTPGVPGGGRRSSDALPPAHSWFAIEWHANGIMRIWEPHVSRLLRANIFLVKGRDRDLVVDAGMGIVSLRDFLRPFTDKPITHLVTHSHVDHVGSSHEFGDDLLMHTAEAAMLRNPPDDWRLSFEEYPEDKRRRLQAAGFDTTGLLIAALPHEGFDYRNWRVPGVAPTRLVDEGDVVDLGDRRFEVMHTPGHSPGSISLWEPASGTLIGGDAIYDGLLIDTLPDSDRSAYCVTMERLRSVPATVVHGGHRESFGASKLKKLCDDYLSTF